MNVELAILLPFFASLLTIFAAPFFSARLQQKRVQVSTNLDHSSIIDNYTGALESAWKRIDQLEKTINLLEQTNREEIRQLREENTNLKGNIYDLEQRIRQHSFGGQE
jgi:peptidoglycan hydrolase CwlO-like protein